MKRINIQRTPFSCIIGFRLFGVDILFGYMKIDSAAKMAEEDCGVEGVNIILERTQDERESR